MEIHGINTQSPTLYPLFFLTHTLVTLQVLSVFKECGLIFLLPKVKNDQLHTHENPNGKTIQLASQSHDQIDYYPTPGIKEVP